jgi:CO/xanthine dehydrogenase FAD-binding subunit
MKLRDEELLSNIHLPRNTKQMSHYYRKVGTRKAQAISKVCFAGTARLDAGRVSHLRIALGSVAPVPLRCLRTEQSVLEQANSGDWISNAINELEREITPISDIRSTKDYRLRVSKNLLEDFLKKLI